MRRGQWCYKEAEKITWQKMIANKKKKLNLVGDDNKLSMPATLGEDNNKQWGDLLDKGNYTQELNCERI